MDRLPSLGSHFLELCAANESAGELWKPSSERSGRVENSREDDEQHRCGSRGPELSKHEVGQEKGHKGLKTVPLGIHHTGVERLSSPPPFLTNYKLPDRLLLLHLH